MLSLAVRLMLTDSPLWREKIVLSAPGSAWHGFSVPGVAEIREISRTVDTLAPASQLRPRPCQDGKFSNGNSLVVIRPVSRFFRWLAISSKGNWGEDCVVL